MNTHLQKKQRLLSALKAQQGATANLDKKTSNLFRHRKTKRVVAPEKSKITTQKAPGPSLKDFNQVIQVDPDKKIAWAEGLTTYQDLVDATLKYDLIPTVVPELKSITIGGAVSGVGVESSAFKFGLVHETILEMEVLLSDGHVIVATPHNEHADLFYGLPNSYGTLGYVLKLKVKLVPVKKYVRLTHNHYTSPQKYFEQIQKIASAASARATTNAADTSRAADNNTPDFLDGTVFSPGDMYITTGQFVDSAPQVSDYTYMNIYYKSIATKQTDFLTAHDYIWRWDTDWFWCSKNLGAQNPILRFLVGRRNLNSINYWKLRAWYSRLIGHSDAKKAGQPRKPAKAESVVQDVEIPVERAAEFLEFFQRKIGIRPIWICPIMPGPKANKFTLYPMPPGQLQINFGFWDVVKSKSTHVPGHFNRLIEEKVRQLGGKKSLYSTSFYPREEFWQLFDKQAYDVLKTKYDPDKRLKGLYEKAVKAV